MATPSWMTKYGRRRVRHEPPTLAEAVAAAEGLTSEPGDIVKLAAELMQVSAEVVRADVEKILRQRVGRSEIQITSGRRSGGAVVVERKPQRRLLVGVAPRGR